MQLESLKVFCDVIRCRSFSRAAAANGISQSAASQAVSHLERRLGLSLIDRSTRPLLPTPSGQRYYEGARDILSAYQELEAGVRGEPLEAPDPIEVAAIYSVGLRELTAYVKRFEAAGNPETIRIECLHPDEVYDRVRRGTVDLGIVSFPRKSREIVFEPWHEEEMVVTCSPANPLSRHKRLGPGDIDGARFVAFDRGLVIRRRIDAFLKSHDIHPTIVLEFDNIENIKKAVDIDTGIALLPRPTIKAEVDAGTLVALTMEGWHLSRPLGIIHPKHGVRSAVRRFITMLREPEESAHDDDRQDGRHLASEPKRLRQATA